VRFERAPDDVKNGIYFRKVSENGLIEFGVWSVLFGFRVRAGFVDGDSYEIDWCGGSEQSSVEKIYSACESILSKREESRSAFDGIPTTSERKPYFNDQEFIKKVHGLGGVFEETEHLPLGLIRARMLQDLASSAPV